MADVPRTSGRRRTRLGWLLAAPFIALLYPPLYARHDPALAGVPFFYWYQLAWIVVSAGLTFAVVRRLAADETDSADTG